MTPLHPTALSLTSIFSLFTVILANTEKIIFKAPSPGPIPLASPSLPDLNLFTLSQEAGLSVRTNLSRVFPSETAPEGEASWVLLDNLTEGQRYELRVCWSALEPTAFTIDVFPLSTVFETPELIQSLASYASSRQTDTAPHSPSNHADSTERQASILLLRVLAAADYFSHKKQLMMDPPPVLVDLILDPYVYNVMPQSLISTVGYIIVISIISWFVSQAVAAKLSSIARSGNDKETNTDTDTDNTSQKKKQ